MTTYNWALPVNGGWTTAANWSPATVPNDAAADVVIDAATTIVGGYTVTLPSGVNELVNSLLINDSDANRSGSNSDPYTAAVFELDGTLTFAPGSPGLIGGSLQTWMHTSYGDNAELINAGTINAFVQVEGNLLLTGTNGIYITNWLQALAGTVTVDTKSIAELAGNVLFDGIFESKGPGSVINLGGPLQNMIVNIETIEGPPLNLVPDGWTQIIFNDPSALIQEWDGTKYVSLEKTLKEIGSRGTVDVLMNRDYTTTNTLTVDAGALLNLQAGTVSVAGLNVNGGVVQGYATIAGNVVNNGTLRPAGGTLDVTGTLSGTGVVLFDLGGTVNTASTLELHSVTAGQTIVMNGNDTLVLDTPAAFAGTIVAQPGDKIVLQGVTATSAALNGGTLVVSSGTTVVDRLSIGGTTTNESFSVNGSIVTVGTGGPTPVPEPTNFAFTNTITGLQGTAAGEAYTGPVAGLEWQYINITTDNINIAANVPNVFLHSGSGMDALDVSHVNGNNVLDGGTGSNFLVGGSGNDTFFLDDRSPAAEIWSTIVNFHAGDNATVWGINQTDFQMLTLDDAGAPGYTGLDLIFTRDGQPAVSFTIAGYSSADLPANGGSRLSLSWGRTQDLPGLPGSDYLLIHGN